MPNSNHILVVDDDPETLLLIETILNKNGYVVSVARSGKDALACVESVQPTLVLLDVIMPNMDGFETFEALRKRPETEHTPVIFVTSLTDRDNVHKCFEIGGTDYISKPIRIHELLARVDIQKQIQRANGEIAEERHVNDALRRHLVSGEIENPDAFAPFITESDRMQSVFQYMESVAGTSRSVLISGETGVGKELVAGTIHKLSGRTGEFVAVNIGGLDDNLFSDTLFGHERGAFTGAEHARAGFIEKAAGGTLFLDEIGDMGPVAQVKLLRLLQELEYYPLGADTPRYTDARVIVATHHDLNAMQRDGRFRKDLYYRLRTHHIHIPPLRERRCDIPLLLEHFINAAADSLGKTPPTAPDKLWPLLAAYDFPGNVREFEAMVFDAISRTRDGEMALTPFQVIDPLPADAMVGEQNIVEGHFPTLKEMSENLISEALDRANGNQTVAAELLGITRQALHKRLARQ